LSRFVAGRLVVLAAFASLLAACSAIPAAEVGTREPDTLDKIALDKIRSNDLQPRSAAQAQLGTAITGKRIQPMIYPGDDQPRVAPVDYEPSVTPVEAKFSLNGDGYDLNLENTPVAMVAKAVLGDVLHVGYVIDPRVQGTVSLSSGRAVPKSDLIFVLEDALRLSGIALVHDKAGYRLMPQSDAVGSGGFDGSDRAEPGYGISVLPLRYVSAQTVLKLMDSFATKPGMVRADPNRNLVLIQGSGSERMNAIDLVLSMDADWMRGQSVGIFPVQNSDPAPIIAELEKIMDSGEGGIGQNVVKLQTVQRMNAVLAVTRKPDVLRRVETWIHRLDNADTGRTGLYVYEVKYGDARAIARVLNEVFGGAAASAGSLDRAPNQIAPGSGLMSSSSGQSAKTRLAAAGTSQDGAFQPIGLAGGGGSSTMAQGFGTSPPPSNRFEPYQGDPLGSPAGGPNGGGSLLQGAGVRITADPLNNTLLINGSQENYRIIERTLRRLDRPQLQVGIETTVAEVTLNDDLSYGVQFFITSKNLGLPANKGSALNATQSPSIASQALNGVISRALPGFNFLIGPELRPNMILDALHSVTDVRVLSNPSVVVVNNEVATLQVGDDVPISTGSATVLTTNNTIVNTIDYRNTGIILHVVPRINANGNVRLDIDQEISNVAPSSGASDALTPTVSQRRVRSSVVVASGQSVLLAGLISDRRTGAREGIPILDQIPGLGKAFSHTEKTGTRTELIIFIRPQIIRDGLDAQRLIEELRSKLGGVATVPPARPVIYK
jgi:general secretion pathway protein D